MFVLGGFVGINCRQYQAPMTWNAVVDAPGKFPTCGFPSECYMSADLHPHGLPFVYAEWSSTGLAANVLVGVIVLLTIALTMEYWIRRRERGRA